MGQLLQLLFIISLERKQLFAFIMADFEQFVELFFDLFLKPNIIRSCGW